MVQDGSRYLHPPTGLLWWLLETQKSQVVTCRVGCWHCYRTNLDHPRGVQWAPYTFPCFKLVVHAFFAMGGLLDARYHVVLRIDSRGSVLAVRTCWPLTKPSKHPKKTILTELLSLGSPMGQMIAYHHHTTFLFHTWRGQLGGLGTFSKCQRPRNPQDTELPRRLRTDASRSIASHPRHRSIAAPRTSERCQ